MVQPVLAPGDMLLFTEASPPLLVRCQLLALTTGVWVQALTHGTLPWTAAHERRTLFYRYVTAGRGGGTAIPKPEEREAFLAAEGSINAPSLKQQS